MVGLGLKKITLNTALYIVNRTFCGLRKIRTIYQHHQIVDLAFKNEQIKNKIQHFGSKRIRNFITFSRPTCHIFKCDFYFLEYEIKKLLLF